ncbi:O-antigen translocase [Chryseobacterium lacus]|nr:O-antigen translocase [Chryseobacterium lacus]
MKATSIFGGVQVFNILIQIIRSKVVAVLLGPTGIGILGLLQTTVALIGAATNFGLGTSAVRDISAQHASGDQDKVKEILSVFRMLALGTGILGMLVTLVLSPWLSQITFGNEEFTWAFRVLSITLLVSQLAAAQTAILQGLRRIQLMAKASIYSSALGLLITLPFYYFFSIKGIVPALLLTSGVIFSVQFFYVKKVNISTYWLPYRKAIRLGKPMLKLGFMLSLSGIIVVASSYLVRVFIVRYGNLSEAGLYNAGFSIITVYVGMVFTAMSTDYFPRLSAVNMEMEKYNELINQQSETAFLILSPLICVFLIFINWAIILLYSNQFLPITEMVHYAILGIYFKALSWSMAFLILAKGDSKAFFWNELVANLYLLMFNCAGYYWDGLRGLGLSFLIGYLLYFLQIYFFIKFKYNFSYNKKMAIIFLMQLPLGIICFFVYYCLQGLWMYILGSFLIFISGGFSFYEMNKSMNLVQSIQSKFRKNEKNIDV